MEAHAKEPHCDCQGPDHHHPRVEFCIDDEKVVVHTDHLKVSEIIDLVDEDPSKHYIVELLDPENIPYHNLDQVIPLRECAAFITVYTEETPVS